MSWISWLGRRIHHHLSWCLIEFLDGPRRAYLRWLENAESTPIPDRYDQLREGLTTTWGELSITVTLDEDDERVYDLRHVDDTGTDADSLDAYDDPLDARTLAKHDDRDRYRPLKTAPTLQSGWVFPELGPTELVQAVDLLMAMIELAVPRGRVGRAPLARHRRQPDRDSASSDLGPRRRLRTRQLGRRGLL